MRRNSKLVPDPEKYANEITNQIKLELEKKLDEIDLIGQLSDSKFSTLDKDFRGKTINYSQIQFQNFSFISTDDPNVFEISYLIWILEPVTNEKGPSYSMMPYSKIIQGYHCEGFIDNIKFELNFNNKTAAAEVDFIDFNLKDQKPFEIKRNKGF